MPIQTDPASFRDPRGCVYHAGDRVFRAVMPAAVEDFEFVRKTALLPQLMAADKLVAETLVDKSMLKELAPQANYVLEHPRLPFVSYPYEWPFQALKAAALLQLEIQLQALESGVSLTDASAYNIQFKGAKPIFIDHLAFCRYVPGSIWSGYRQFCEQFLNPLLLQTYVGISANTFYRSNIDGLAAKELKALLPLYRQFLPKVFMHVVLQSLLQKNSNQAAATVLPKINFSLASFQKLLRKLQDWITALQPKKTKTSIWCGYTQVSAQVAAKIAAVTDFVQQAKPGIMYDLGCNTGQYAELALQRGARLVIGIDSDETVLNGAFSRAEHQNLNFLPLYMDLANPSPDQGWNQEERLGLMKRGPVNAVLALAVVHHLALTRNIPLGKIINWLLELAPQGLVEFVPKQDSMVQEMLCLRDDVFADYSLDNFLQHIKSRAEIIKIYPVAGSERKLIWYRVNEYV